MKTKLVGALLALGLLTGLFLAAPPAAAAATVMIDPPKYHPFLYVPGEQMQFTINILTTDPRDYDLLVVWDDSVTRTNWSGPPNGAHQFDDVNVPAPGTSLVLNFDIPTTMPDGDYYWVEVHDTNWIETNGTSGVTWDVDQFSVRTWTLNLELDKSRYLPGDMVTVIWSVNMIRDGSLAPPGYGQIWAWDWPTNNRLDLNPWPYAFTAPTGTVTFQLLGSIPTNRWVTVYAYYNNTATSSDRTGYDSAAAPVDGLRMMVNVPSGSYEPGAIVTVDVNAKITDFAPVSSDPGAAGVEVDVTVTDQTTGQVIPQYGASNLATDIHGNLKHVFQLNGSIPDGTSFLVRADGVANNAVTSFATDTFIVSSNAGMSLVLTFNKNQYVSGDTVTVTALVSGSPGPFTYIYEARDGGVFGPLLDRQTIGVNTYSYAIPTDFAGTIAFVVTADDGNGGRAQASRTFSNVALGILVVTLDRTEYGAGDTITAAFSLTTNVLTGATYYYEILNTGGFPDVLIESGIATGSSVSYQVPSVPADEYTFRITAARDGRALSGQATAYLASGYILSISPDRTSYKPGETMQVTYSISARGRSALPSAFMFYVTVAGAPGRYVQTTSPSGVLTYTVPGGVNEGQVALTVYEFSTGASASEVVTIGDTNPLMTLVGGVPTITWILALLVLFAFILIVMMWRKMMGGAPGPKAAPSGPSAPAPPPVTAAPGPAPMAVNCKACGSAIEITTSKRPIEVMCPSCGETQMVQ